MNHHRNNIPGIHNYCDRWCERCFFTARCAVYEDLENQSPEEQDINNKAFWDHLSDTFKNALAMLEQAAEEYGFDPNNISKEERAEYEDKENKTRLLVKQHPISLLGLQYLEQAKKILEQQPLQKEAEIIIHQVEMGMKTEEDALVQILKENDCIEVIQWYLYFIHIKFTRALSGQFEDDGWQEANGFQRDCDGSAKIALIATERSMQAWAQLLNFSPGREDEILPLLAILDKIRKMGQSEFPKAEKFIRPGFDDSL